METISRRKFIEFSSIAGAFLVIGCVPDTDGKNKIVARLASDIKGIELNQFISIAKDGSIILFNHRPEMGQGTFQSIPMILAEELEVDIDQVIIRQSEANRELFGSQMVVGSRSIQTEYEKMRLMGAGAREMLKQAAANRWKVSIDQCTAKNGTVVSSTGEVLQYGDLIEIAGTLEPPSNPALKSPSEFKVIGKPTKRQDIPVKTNGEAIFGIDISVPGMLYASVERSPVFLGKLKRFNKEEVLQMPGIKHVIETKRTVYGRSIEGVAVLATSYWAALQGRKALKINWETENLKSISSESILNDYYEEAKSEGNELFGRGNASSVLRTSKNIIEASYETPYQAHVPMEPMNAIVSIREDSAEFWGSTQNPNGIRSFLSGRYNIPENEVKINYTFMGGGFGRRSMTDVVEEAADLSKKSGVPVKVIWTREDDQTQGPFRACSLNVCKAVLDGNGKVNALEHKVIAQEIRNQSGDKLTAGRQLMGGINTDYQIPNLSVKGVLQRRHIPISYWRAVYHSTNPFAHESFIDELAIKAGKDPLQFRLDMLDHPRYRRVLKEAALITNWNSPRAKDTGKGIATVERSGAYFATVVDVGMGNKGIELKKITVIIDLGICINPDTVKAQTESSTIMGLGAAFTGLTVENGGIKEQNFDSYPLMKYGQCPEIETVILKSEAPPDGAGETGLPTVAPALVNAIFDMTGKRIRKLPLDLKNIVS